MTRFATLCAALLLATPAAAQDELQPGNGSGIEEPAPAVVTPNSDPEDFDLAKKKVVECEGEKFVFAWGAGARPTKVTLCSKKNATPEEVVQMLDNAATKLEQTNIAEDRRTAIVQQIRAKISQLKGASVAAAAPVVEPTAAVAQVAVKPPQPAVEPPAVPALSNAASAVSTPVLAKKPRLTLRCSSARDRVEARPCGSLERDTLITVQADEALPNAATRLVFLRRGKPRAEVALAQMLKGSSRRFALPRQLCSGVVTSEIEIQILSRSSGEGVELVDTLGPYEVRC